MKSVIIASLTFVFLTAFNHRGSLEKTASLTCILKSDKTNYKVGELPDFKIEIINNTEKDIYLIGSLDGSDIKWRMPYCYFTIQEPKPDSVDMVGRCGNMNTLKPQDFVLIKAGAKFNPYMSLNEYGFFTDHTVTNSQTFQTPGVYRIQFHYSTNSQKLDDFMGDRPLQQDKAKRQKLVSLLQRVPKVDIVSNEIEITIGN
ncbi:MAG: hypothetical protein EOO46_13445 [Flavobacterium sp.]|nr:MAG: hypothetical protein EOO46_13445 [Flavobacterium sp.]